MCTMCTAHRYNKIFIFIFDYVLYYASNALLTPFSIAALSKKAFRIQFRNVSRTAFGIKAANSSMTSAYSCDTFYNLYQVI